jgi:subtilase family serine protease
MRLTGRTSLLAAAAAIVGLAGTLAAAGPSAAAPDLAPVSLSASAAAPLPAGTVRLGAVSPGTEVSFSVTFNERNQGLLDTLLAGLGNKKSPYFKDFITPARFGQLFGPTDVQLEQVESVLRAAGLHPGTVQSDRVEIPVTGTAAAVERAFGVGLSGYRLPGGRSGFRNTTAPQVPGSIAPLVSGLVGLDTMAAPSSMSQIAPGASASAIAKAAAQPAKAAATAAAGPQPCSSAIAAAAGNGTYTASQLASHYGITPLYGLGDLGQGVRVGLPDLDPFSAADVNGFYSCYHLSTKYTVTTVTAGVGSGYGDGEAASDLENIASIAPDVTIDMYQSPNTLDDLLTDLDTIASSNRDQVVAIPYGICEADVNQAYLSAVQKIVNVAAAAGQTWIASSGDTGTTGCYGDGDAGHSTLLSVQSPASASDLLAVGGTAVSASRSLSEESAWNSSAAGNQGGASGGGISTQCMPVYQSTNELHPTVPPLIPNLISALSKTATKCVNAKSNPQGYLREVPDVSADADYHTGYQLYWHNTWDYRFGGTSDAAGLVAAEAALIDSSPYCGAEGWQSWRVGLYPEFLYAVVNQFEPNVYQYSPPASLYDPTRGNNDYTPSGLKDGFYSAAKGYDLATGLGAPLLTGVGTSLPLFNTSLAAYMCLAAGNAKLTSVRTISVSPSSIPAGKTVTVTVHGSGMLLVPGTDGAVLMYQGKQVYFHTVTCKSRTECKLTIPGAYTGQPRTDSVRLEAVGLFSSTGSQLAPLKIVKK